ncbi:hypothetical protein [Actinomadura rubrisoli]|uniref:Uncharacterized protein n=1 Tax=Actinomadura rubrisoli TaxID=2530368 RepID=A0A4R5CH94_9ACTN|nr:hypothetical protein [Actinomadura rubrisoli]TDD97673.1 hypothetical protein E1298_01160 [Actinomadura rubrisoli]
MLTNEDPHIGGVDIDTWRAQPAPDNPGGTRTRCWVILAGEYDETDVWIEVHAEYPKDVAEFIVQAVRNEHARQQAR